MALRKIKFLFLVSFVIGQDSYPYFSDMAKQLEFEKKKIEVVNTKESRQFITGGGSEFNWLSLISNYEPTYLIAPIKTDFFYVTEFSITQNGKVLSEIDFLNTIGLNEIAERLISDYIETIKKFKGRKKIVFDEYKYLDTRLRGTLSFPLGVLFSVTGLWLVSSDMNAETLSIFILWSGFTVFTYKMMTAPKSKFMKEYDDPPQLKQY